MSIEIESIETLITLLRDRIGADNRILWYRGHRDASWTLLPFVKREYDSDGERNLTHRFRSRAGTRYERLPGYDDLPSWLALMQHYGLPTRLLDWTRSPMVALFFALDGAWRLKNSQPTDANLWVLEPHALNVAQGYEPVTAALNAKTYRELIEPAYYHKSKEPGTVAAAMASETDQRMFVQQGCFTIHSSDTELEKLILPPHVLTRLTIPAKSVRQLSFDIELCGFRRGDLFPDLQNLADELKRTYGA
jgi:FRG domain